MAIDLSAPQVAQRQPCGKTKSIFPLRKFAFSFNLLYCNVTVGYSQARQQSDISLVFCTMQSARVPVLHGANAVLQFVKFCPNVTGQNKSCATCTVEEFTVSSFFTFLTKSYQYSGHWFDLASPG